MDQVCDERKGGKDGGTEGRRERVRRMSGRSSGTCRLEREVIDEGKSKKANLRSH